MPYGRYGRRRRRTRRRTKRRGGVGYYPSRKGRTRTLTGNFRRNIGKNSLVANSIGPGHFHTKHETKHDGILIVGRGSNTTNAVGVFYVAAIHSSSLDHPYTDSGTYAPLGQQFINKCSTDPALVGPHQHTISHIDTFAAIFDKVKVKWVRYDFKVKNLETFPVIVGCNLGNITGALQTGADEGLGQGAHGKLYDQITRLPKKTFIRLGAHNLGRPESDYTKSFSVYLPQERIIKKLDRYNGDPGVHYGVPATVPTDPAAYCFLEFFVGPEACDDLMTIEEVGESTDEYGLTRVEFLGMISHGVAYKDPCDPEA